MPQAWIWTITVTSRFIDREVSFMRQLVLYIHGKGGNAMEADHYKTLFAGYDVIGIDYHADNPWDAISEFKEFFHRYRQYWSLFFNVCS